MESFGAAKGQQSKAMTRAILRRRLTKNVLKRRMKLRKYRFAAKMHSENQAELSSEVWISLNGFGEFLRALLHMGGLSDAMQKEDAFSVILPSHLLFRQGVKEGGQTASFVRWNAHRSG